MGTILQKCKTGNKKITDILSDQTIPRFVVSHFYIPGDTMQDDGVDFRIGIYGCSET